MEEYLIAYPDHLLQHPDADTFEERSFENLYNEAIKVKNGKYDDFWTNPYRVALVNWSYDYTKWYESKKRYEKEN